MRFAFFNIRSGSMTGQFWVAQSFFRIKSRFYILWLMSQNNVLFNVRCNIQDCLKYRCTGAIYLLWIIIWGNIFYWDYLFFHGRHCLQMFTGRFMHQTEWMLISLWIHQGLISNHRNIVADAFAMLSCPPPETGKSKFSPAPGVFVTKTGKWG